jgi:hypothetical protein
MQRSSIDHSFIHSLIQLFSALDGA